MPPWRAPTYTSRADYAIQRAAAIHNPHDNFSGPQGDISALPDQEGACPIVYS